MVLRFYRNQRQSHQHQSHITPQHQKQQSRSNQFPQVLQRKKMTLSAKENISEGGSARKRKREDQENFGIGFKKLREKMRQ